MTLPTNGRAMFVGRAAQRLMVLMVAVVPGFQRTLLVQFIVRCTTEARKETAGILHESFKHG